ncbi:MAGE-domain-containing protein [Jaminaea rosea]|uniref:MAGE-domain-containing protein n=1 Tax=Jaminaea rosea TaxID=1569628 RepID=A0A316UYW3_9BASI|nr:MAGE-domain-containing protein [Jaminaea rosea]PWN30402.1 MAGE-domain-containing protein [Jaminaea rosea]
MPARTSGLARPANRGSARPSSQRLQQQSSYGGRAGGRSGGARRGSASTNNARSAQASTSRRAPPQVDEGEEDETGEASEDAMDEGGDAGGEVEVEEEDDDDAQDEDEDLRVKKRVRLPVSEGVKKLVNELGKQEIERKSNDLVRLALFSEQRRLPIRRDEISKKVLGKNAARAFPYIFNQAQKILRSTFCYEMVELRARGAENEQLATQAAATAASSSNRRDKTPERDERAKKAAVSKSWVLRSILPAPVISSMAAQDAELAAAMADDGLNDDDEDENPAGPSSRTAASSRAPRGGGTLLDWNKADGQLGSMGLTFLILSLILLNGRSLPDDQFRALLHRLGLQNTKQLPETLRPDSAMPLAADGTQATQRNASRNSDAAGGAATDTVARPSSLQSFLNQLLKHQYLEKVSTGMTNARGTTQQQTQRARGARKSADGQGDDRMEWRWGPRAEVEIGEVAVADFVSAVYVDAAPGQAVAEEEVGDGIEASQAPISSRRAGRASTGRSGRSQTTGTAAATQAQTQRDKQTQALRREIERAAGSQLII